MELNNDNYYSLEADREYMSYSQYKEFRSCEARAMARLAGWQEEEDKTSLLVGKYVHAWAEGSLEQFKAEHPEILTKNGTLKAEFRQAEEMIKTIQSDRLMMLALEGEKEVIITAEFGGCLWKAKLDVVNHDRLSITELKTARSLLDKYWDGQRYTHFIEAYGYIGQMALYQELAWRYWDNKYDVFMAVVTKENPPDKLVVTFNPIDRLGYELDRIIENLPHVLDVKAGRVKPVRCENCAYCRETNQLDKVWDYDEFLFERF